MYCGRRRSLRHFAVFICLILAPAMFSGALFTSSPLRGLSFAEILALSLFLSLFFFQVTRSELPARAASSPQGPFRSPLGPLAACFFCLRLLFPKTLLPQCFREPFSHRRRSAAAAPLKPCSITLPSSLLFPGNSPSVGRKRRRCRFPYCGGGSPRCPLVRASPKSGRRPFPSPSSRSAP